MSTVPERPTRDRPSPPTARHPTDLLAVCDLSEPEFQHVLHLAASMKHGPADRWTASLPGRMISGYLETPFARTRTSFTSAATRLGMTTAWLRPDDFESDTAEPIAATVGELAAYSAAIVVRTGEHSAVAEIAAASSVPTVNAGSDQHHPCQALADIFTLREHFGELAGLRLAYIGDGGNLARSLSEAAGLSGVEIMIASPERFQFGAGDRSRADELAAHHSHITIVDDPREAVAGADAVYAGRWSPVGLGAGSVRPIRSREHFRVTPELTANARPHTVVMHSLPARRGQEVEAALIDGPQSLVAQQAANRVPVQEAVLYSLIRDCWMPEEQ